KGGDAGVGGEAELVECAGEAAGALGPLAVGLALRAVGRPRRDVLLREEPLGPVEDVRDGERVVLHQPLHQRATVRSTLRVPSITRRTHSCMGTPDLRSVCNSTSGEMMMSGGRTWSSSPSGSSPSPGTRRSKSASYV